MIVEKWAENLTHSRKIAEKLRFQHPIQTLNTSTFKTLTISSHVLDENVPLTDCYLDITFENDMIMNPNWIVSREVQV